MTLFSHVIPELKMGMASLFAHKLRSLLTMRQIIRARVLGAAMRVAYYLSASMPGVLRQTPLQMRAGSLVLTLQQERADLVSDRLSSRLKQLGRLVGSETVVQIR